MQRSLSLTATMAVCVSSLSLGRAQSTTVGSVDSNGIAAKSFNIQAHWPVISADGRVIEFAHSSDALVAGDHNGTIDVFVHDRSSGATELVSLGLGGQSGDDQSDTGGISSDGRWVSFTSYADDLVANDTNHTVDIFVRDRAAQTTERVSVASDGSQANGLSFAPSITSDGRFVLFASDADNLVLGDTNASTDVFLRDLASHTTERVSLSNSSLQGNHASFLPPHPHAISADGRFVVFTSAATNLLGFAVAGVETYVRDRVLGSTELLSATPSGGPSAASAGSFSISDDGRFVAFSSIADDLVAGTSGLFVKIYVRDRSLGLTSLASVDSNGVQGNGASDSPDISRDGRVVTFVSAATQLVAGDTNGAADVFAHDLTTGATTRESTSSTGQELVGSVYSARVSGDGRVQVFDGLAFNLVPGLYTAEHTYLHDRASTATTATYCTAKTNSQNCTPAITSSGLAALSATDDFFVTARNLLADKSGIFFWGTQPASIPFGGGTLCVQPPLVRGPVQSSGHAGWTTPCTGQLSFHFASSILAAHSLGAGSVVYGQFWTRDPGFAPPQNIGLSDALVFTVAP